MAYSVLVVDDESLTLRTISRALRDEDFDVFTATSGEEALRIFHDGKPDLTLLDIILPGIDGVEVLRQIKCANPSSIVLMMSACHMVDRAVEAMKLGAFDYLIKPFHLSGHDRKPQARHGDAHFARARARKRGNSARTPRLRARDHRKPRHASPAGGRSQSSRS